MLGQLRPQPQALADRHAVVAIAVDHQERGADAVHEAVRRVLHHRLGCEDALPVLRAVGRAAELIHRPQARVRHDRTEAVGVPGDPVGHVAAERAAHRRGLRLVDIGTTGDGIRDRHQVGVGLAAPAVPAAGDELQAVAGRQGRVRQQHGVAASRREQRRPSPAPRVPAGERAAVDPQQQRCGRGIRCAFRQQQPSAHAGAVLGDRLDLGDRRRCRGQRGRCHQGGHGSVARDAHGVRRREPVGAQCDEVARRAIDRDVRVREVVGRELLGCGPVERDAVDRPAAVRVGGRDQRRIVGGELDAGRPAVPVGGEAPGVRSHRCPRPRPRCRSERRVSPSRFADRRACGRRG